MYIDDIWMIENSGIKYGRHLETYMIQKRYHKSGWVEEIEIPLTQRDIKKMEKEFKKEMRKRGEAY